jgi:hypothetical protein
MKAQILTTTITSAITTATLLTAFSGVLSAADPQLLNLVMPDAKVLAGVNVEQAKGTQFGQYVLNQMQSQDAHMRQLIALTGFDPTRDVRELLVATTGSAASHTGLALARGYFDAARITAAATEHGAVIEDYNGVNILEDPKKNAGMAFLDATTVAAGDIPSVKGAIDRQKTAQPLPAAVTVKVNQWSNAQDAWAISTVPPTSLVPPNAIKNSKEPNPMASAFQNVQQAAGGVKFGAMVVFSGEAVADTAASATSMGDVLKLLVNLAQMQAGQDQQVSTLVKAVTISTSGETLKVSLSLPQEQFLQMVEQSHGKKGAARVHRQ